MSNNPESEKQAIRMQKLRRAVERIRRVQAPTRQSPERRSWIKRLLDRLGLAGNAEDNQKAA